MNPLSWSSPNSFSPDCIVWFLMPTSNLFGVPGGLDFSGIRILVCPACLFSGILSWLHIFIHLDPLELFQENEWISIKDGSQGLIPCLLDVLSCFSHVQLFATLWTIACQAPLSMGFSRKEYWSGLPCPPPEDLLNPEIKPMSFWSPSLSAGFFTTSAMLVEWKSLTEMRTNG